MCLATVNPILSSEWHPTKNGELTPDKVFPKSNTRVWWIYPCGHEGEACIFTRNNGSGCFICNTSPISYSKSLVCKNSNLSKEWHPYENGSLDPSNISAYSLKKVWWICKNNHMWSQSVKKRMLGEGCPYCLIDHGLG